MIGKLSNTALAYQSARLAVGASILVHGAVRLPKLSGFAEGMAGQFSETIVAGFPALSMAYLIPFVEVLVGVLILIGRTATRYGLALGILLMGLLMVGCCLIENWTPLVSQLVHLIAFYLLLLNPMTRGPEDGVS